METEPIKTDTEAERLLYIYEHSIKYTCGHKLYYVLQEELAELRKLRGEHMRDR